jgi:predicted RNA-binding protein YlxR (DUF448 family)
LLRIAVLDDGARRTRRAVHDRACTMPGRGAYLCRAPDDQSPLAECLALAVKRGGIARALRCRVTVDPKLVESIAT